MPDRVMRRTKRGATDLFKVTREDVTERAIGWFGQADKDHGAGVA